MEVYNDNSAVMDPEIQDHGFAFFSAVEKEMNVPIADHLKNLLIFNGYHNNISFSQLTENDIPELELFAKNLLPDLIKERTSEYFGLFKNNVEQFQILSGEKKLLLFIAEHLKSKQENLKTTETSTQNYDSDGQAAKRIKYEQSDDGNDESGLIAAETEDEDEVTVDLTGSGFHQEENSSEALKFAIEKQNIRLTERFKRLIRNMAIKYQLTDITEDVISTLKTEIQCNTWPPSLDALTGLAKCVICSRTIKIQKTKNGWIYSNFGKHFQLHMKPDQIIRPLLYHQQTL